MILMSGSGGRGPRGRSLVRKYARRRKRRRERKEKKLPTTRHPTPDPLTPPQPGGREILFLDHGVALPWQNFNKYGLKKSNPFSDNHWTLGTSGTRYYFFFGGVGGVCVGRTRSSTYFDVLLQSVMYYTWYSKSNSLSPRTPSSVSFQMKNLFYIFHFP